MATGTAAMLPPAGTPLSDKAGNVSTAWYQYFLSLFVRTGTAKGVDAASVSQSVNTAQQTAITAQVLAADVQALVTVATEIANTGVSSAETAQATANAALTLAGQVNATAATQANFVELGIAPQQSPTFEGAVTINGLLNCPNDAAAATVGVALNQVYRNGSTLMIRVT